MKKNRYFKTLACLLVGAVLLSGSAYANYDNANGYTNYKDAIKKFLYVENFSMQADLSLEHNGTTLESASMTYMYDRNGNPSEHIKEVSSDGSNTSDQWIQDGKNISIYSGDDEFYAYEAYSKGFNDEFLNDTTENKEYTEKTVRFIELLADTFVGDLKNNFVLSSNEDGKRTYQVNLQGQQIPTYINAGLDLMFSSYQHDFNRDPYWVTFEDYAILDEATDDEYSAYFDNGYNLLDENGGIGVVCVMKDGTMKYFATEAEYDQYFGYDSYEDVLTDDIFQNLSNPSIESANCMITLDEKGNIIENNMDGTLVGYDENGNKHTYTLRINLKFYDYGSTTITPIDISKVTVNN